MPTFNDARIRKLNAHPTTTGEYVLYWCQASRRLSHNHALDYALFRADKLRLPLVIYEGLRLDYPWACARHHAIMLQGMQDNAKHAQKLGVTYWPFVETPDQPARGLLRKLAAKACLVVTDDYPNFIVPGQSAALASKIDVPMVAVDSNGMIPLALYGDAVSAAAHLRPRVHRLFAEGWQYRAAAEPVFPKHVRTEVVAPFSVWNPDVDLPTFLAGLPINQEVQPVATAHGGTTAARKALKHFLAKKLDSYADGRNNPDAPDRNAASQLSAHFRHGHLAMQEVVEAVLTHEGPWEPSMLDMAHKNKREGYFSSNTNVNSFLDEALTWRDVGYHWHHCRNQQRGPPTPTWHTLHGQKIPAYYDLASCLPKWAMDSLNKHRKDARAYTYTLEEWEAADTHDPLWNAAQRELVTTGRIHNYLRMLWGKKVLEWSATPEEAYLVLEHLNNKYAVDGRDPNSYTGIHWCFGLFDRPWAPERNVFGVLRYMSSDNTAKKFDLDGYYDYVKRLPALTKHPVLA